MFVHCWLLGLTLQYLLHNVCIKHEVTALFFTGNRKQTAGSVSITPVKDSSDALCVSINLLNAQFKIAKLKKVMETHELKKNLKYLKNIHTLM